MLHYSKKQVRRAGETISSPSASPSERAEAEAVVNFWRNIHRRPLQLLLQELDERGISAEHLVAGRIKKFDTIVDKLTRRNAIANLAAMDDIAGCRIVVPDLGRQASLCDALYEISECDTAWSDRHDYIGSPKESGYRGRHLLFRYQDPRHGYALPIELQVRTEHQHAWATAVEMYDEVAADRLKFGEGQSQADRFFRRISVVMRQLEERGRVEPSSIRSLDDGTDGLQAALDILRMLSAASQSVYVLGGGKEVAPESYCLVDFDPAEQVVELTEVCPEVALETYFASEDDPDREGHNFVLLRGATLDKLKDLYPNYFGDISRFVTIFNDLIYKNLPAFA